LGPNTRGSEIVLFHINLSYLVEEGGMVVLGMLHLAHNAESVLRHKQVQRQLQLDRVTLIVAFA
jgi:hypothetical protein